MRSWAVIVFALVLAAPHKAEGVVSKLEADARADFSEKPITKVINLLKDMQAQLEKEMEKDIELYDTMVCWCTENDKLKTKAIADAEAHLEDLQTAIEEMTAKSAQLKTDIETLESETAENEKTLMDASAIREKDNSVFVDEEKDSMQMVSGLNGAVQALGKHHSTPGAELADEQEPAPAFLQRNSLLRQPVATSSYDSQSGAIFGILRTMKENGEEQLATMQKQETKAADAHAKLSTSKNDELAAAKEQLEEKRQELAETDENLANAKADNRDTTAQLDADRVFLADLKERCGSMDEQWAVRKKMRTEETTAVSEAIAILADDDAKDLAHKTVGSSFLQASSMVEQNRRELVREKAATILRRISSAHPKASIANLVAMLQSGDIFAKIKEAITTMVAQLKEQQKEEVKQKEYCKTELHKNEMELTAGYESKEDLDGQIEDLHELIKELGDRVEDAKEQVSTTLIELKKAAENRGKQNLEFQMTISDQRQMQAVLQKALDKLKAFYDKKAGSFLQQAPPPGFKPYKKAGGSGGVVGFIMNIIGESQKTEQEAKTAEQEAQKTYEEFVAASNTVLKDLDQSLADMAGQRAKADQDLVVAKEELGTTLKNLMSLSEMSSELHGECDFVLKNFAARQQARTAEIEGLTQAHQVLSGASFD